jgi:hypothetical protein
LTTIILFDFGSRFPFAYRRARQPFEILARLQATATATITTTAGLYNITSLVADHLPIDNHAFRQAHSRPGRHLGLR